MYIEFVFEGHYFLYDFIFFNIDRDTFRNQSFISPVGSTYKLNRYDKNNKLLKDNDIKAEGSNPKVIVVNQNQENENC